MHQNDFDAFATLMQRLAKIYGKKLDDDVVQGYWRALKDQTLTTITERVESHIRYAKFFPKPFEMRPKDDKPDPTPDGKFEEGEERAMRRLEEMRQENPQAWMKYLEKHHSPNCRALIYANQFGVENIYFDIPNRCWRRLQ
jgi:hypothetical protein